MGESERRSCFSLSKSNQIKKTVFSARTARRRRKHDPVTRASGAAARPGAAAQVAAPHRGRACALLPQRRRVAPRKRQLRPSVRGAQRSFLQRRARAHGRDMPVATAGLHALVVAKGARRVPRARWGVIRGDATVAQVEARVAQVEPREIAHEREVARRGEVVEREQRHASLVLHPRRGRCEKASEGK